MNEQNKNKLIDFYREHREQMGGDRRAVGLGEAETWKGGDLHGDGR